MSAESLRKIEFTPAEKLYFGKAPILPEVETIEKLNEFAQNNNSSIEEIYAIHRGIFDLKNEPAKFRTRPKVHINEKENSEKTSVQIISWPISVALKGISNHFTADGLSLGVKPKNSEKIVSIQRSTKNYDCGGFLGTVAGYLIKPYINFEKREMDENIFIKDLLTFNAEDQLSHEFGINKDEYILQIIGKIAVDYPTNQEEYIGIVNTSLTEKELTERIISNKGTPTGLAENRVILLKPEQIQNFISRKDIPTASAHIFALSMAANIQTETIKNIPKHNPKETFTTDIASLL